MGWRSIALGDGLGNKSDDRAKNNGVENSPPDNHGVAEHITGRFKNQGNHKTGQTGKGNLGRG